MGLDSIQSRPGFSGTVRIHVEQISDVLYESTEDDNYASAVFYPAYFDPKIITGTTDYTVTYHLPPGVKPDEPKWYEAPDGFPSQPETGFDDQGRITYKWHNPNANGYTVYEFGASFPMSYIPSNAIVKENHFAGIVAFISSAIIPILCIGGFIAIVASGLRV